MSNACLQKLYAKFRYIPPQHPAVPADCKRVTVTKSPEIRIFSGQISKLEGQRPGELIGLDLHCVVPYTSGAGGLILLLQVGSYIEWEVEFTTLTEPPPQCTAPWARNKLFDNPLAPAPGPYTPVPRTPIVPKVVRETHRVYVSLPMMYKLAGPRMLLMAASPWKIKLPVYAVQIWNAFRKLEELEKPLALVLALKKGMCPEDIRKLEEELKKLEAGLNSLLQRVQGSGGGDLAQRMRTGGDGAGRFAGTRLA